VVNLLDKSYQDSFLKDIVSRWHAMMRQHHVTLVFRPALFAYFCDRMQNLIT